MHSNRTWIACLIALCVPSVGASKDFCSELRQVLLTTEAGYKPLQRGFDHFLNEYEGSVVPPPFEECQTNATPSSARYTCRARLPDDETAAKAVLAGLKLELERCLGKTIARRSGSPDYRLDYRHVDSGESIVLSVRRHVSKDDRIPPRFGLSLRVSTVDVSVK